MNRLTNSDLIRSLTAQGIWKTEKSASKIRYTCLACDNDVHAVLEVIPAHTHTNFKSFAKKYYFDRRLRCQRLSGARSGRCIFTKPAQMRGGALTGFQSKTERGDKKEIEVIFFYNERGLRPELLKLTVEFERDGDLPKGSLEMFRWHMAKLTVFW